MNLAKQPFHVKLSKMIDIAEQRTLKLAVEAHMNSNKAGPMDDEFKREYREQLLTLKRTLMNLTDDVWDEAEKLKTESEED